VKSWLEARGERLGVVGARGSTPNNIDLQNKKGDMPNDTRLTKYKNRANLSYICYRKSRSVLKIGHFLIFFIK
jgi:hypothetical protein